MPARIQPFPRTTCEWMRALEHEELIDIGEWCTSRSLANPLPTTSAMTWAVCDAIERVPFRLLRRVTASERGRGVFARAASLLAGRSLECPHARAARVLTFNASLPCRAEDRTWRRLLLRSDRLEPSALFHVIALETPEVGCAAERRKSLVRVEPRKLIEVELARWQ